MKPPTRLILRLVLLAIAGLGAWKFINSYRTWHSHKSIQQAKEFFQQGRPDLAAYSLAMVHANERKDPEFLDTEAHLFSLLGNSAGAKRAYADLLALQPAGKLGNSARFNLAQLMLNTQSPQESEKAAALIHSLPDEPNYAPHALRLLAQRALQTGNVTEALAIGWKLGAVQGAPFGDRLLQLDILLIGNSPLLDSAIVTLKQTVSGDTGREAALANWILNRKGAVPVVEWLEALPPAERTSAPLAPILAAGYNSLKNWKALQVLISGTNWGRNETQRLTYLSASYRGLNQKEMAAMTWKSAIRSARDEPRMAANLARLADSEFRTEDALEALWSVPVSDPDRTWARRRLFAEYRARNDSANLIRLMTETLAEYPQNASAKRSLASLLLITNRDPVRASRLARELYEAGPDTLSNVVLQAYSICVNGDAPRAAAMLDARSPDEKSSDECLPYYGVILARCGRDDEAKRCFQKLNRQILFPEMAATISKIEAGSK